MSVVSASQTVSGRYFLALRVHTRDHFLIGSDARWRNVDRALSRPESGLFTRKNEAQNLGRFRSSLLIGLLGSLYAFAFQLVTGSTSSNRPKAVTYCLAAF